MNAHRCVLVVLAAAASAATASAGVTAVPEFVGERSEFFETGNPGTFPGPMPIFQGTATMDDSLAHIAVVAFNWFGPAGTILPQRGALFGGTVAGATLFEFSTPQRMFGGYMNTVGLQPGGTINFRDGSGGLVGSAQLGVQPVTWLWQGWMTDAPFTSIEVIGAGVPGISLQYDSLQVSTLPAPASAVLLGLAGLATLRRR